MLLLLPAMPERYLNLSSGRLGSVLYSSCRIARLCLSVTVSVESLLSGNLEAPRVLQNQFRPLCVCVCVWRERVACVITKEAPALTAQREERAETTGHMAQISHCFICPQDIYTEFMRQ